MYSIQDTREAQQMWAYKFENAGREGITLSSGKLGSLAGFLNWIFRNTTTKPAGGYFNLGMEARKARATT